MKWSVWRLLLALALIGSVSAAANCSDDDDDDDDAEGDDTGDDGDDDDDAEETWTDTETGLMWQNGPTVGGEAMQWTAAIEHCEVLTWAEYDDWRLPTIDELRTLVRGCADTATGGACEVTDACLDFDECWDDPCTGCDQDGGPAPGGLYWPDELTGAGSYYWSSSAIPDYEEYAWSLAFDAAYIYDDHMNNDLLGARCVR